MKRLLLFVCFTGIFISGCDKGFEKVNTNPVQATSLDPAYLLTSAQLGAMIYTLQYQDPIVQEMNTPFGSSLEVVALWRCGVTVLAWVECSPAPT